MKTAFQAVVAFLLLFQFSIPATPMLSVCDRSEDIKRLLSNDLDKPCDQITSSDLATIESLYDSLFFGDVALHLEVSELKNGDFDGLVNLKGIYFNRGQISELPDRLFVDTKKLKHLLIRNHFIESITPNLHEQLPELERLILTDNRLTEFPHTISQLPKLDALGIDGNLLNTLPFVKFRSEKLTRLWIGSNKGELTFVPGLSHKQFPNLKVAEVQCAAVTSKISHNFFWWMKAIESLELDGCSGIESLDLFEFRDMTQLKTLRIYRSGLRSLPKDFSYLPNLETLILYGHRNAPPIPAPDKDTFQSLSHLKSLGISFVIQEGYYELGTFHNLPKLEELLLIGNGLNFFPANSFQGTEQITSLHARENEFTQEIKERLQTELPNAEIHF